ncbi:MAG: hypothetical protein JSS09_06510, partial [Verrucomicrobia bacterium]|nr:hypothetical protein [Verrucomicrobiota bacterium]
ELVNTSSSGRASETSAEATSNIDVISMFDNTGTKREGELRLKPGNHILTPNYGPDRDPRDITTENPIYLFLEAQFPGMKEPGSCLVMHQEDFKKLQNNCHSGAFGGDYHNINNDFVAVWKIPADLKAIDHWIPTTEPTNKKPTKLPVGRYLTFPDTESFLSNPSQFEMISDTVLYNLFTTKYRYEFPKRNDGTVSMSVHHLELEKPHLNKVPGDKLAAFSTGNIMENFDDPNESEKRKIETLLIDLEQAGIKAFVCNGWHHSIVLSHNTNGKIIGAKDVASMLRDLNTGPKIIQALKKASKQDPSINIDTWAENFIQAYGE